MRTQKVKYPHETNEDSSSESKKPELDKLAEELGPDVVRHLHRAFKLTAAALYRRAVEQAEAQLQKRQDS